ncbi:MAG: metalloregulator ArsR/SmtB family transcription factor [Candidatus Eisenbacteria bacterium]
MLRPFSALQELGDTTRLSVFLAVLGIRKNVSQIVAELGLTQPQVSYHLRKLKDAGLAVEEKDGRWVWYQANWDTGDRNLRDFIEFMSRWAVDAGATEGGRPATAGGGTGVEPLPVGVQPVTRPRPARPEERPTVERPKKRDSDMDDFLL